MPSFCAVVNCNDRYKYGHSENISFHKFPLKRQDLLMKWESFIQKQRGAGWRASRWSSLCSRHFREDDFRSLNERKTLKKSAVPSILDGNKKKSKITFSTAEDDYFGDKEFKEILAIREELEDVGCTSKTNCRLCGVNSVPVVTIVTNYELYGMLQKCFPTLNIQQEDAFPKGICSPCYKNLEHFGEFVDIVWAAQTELQKKYRSRTVEKPLKIKQEPLVRVKQEVAEVGYDQQQELIGAGNDDYEVIADGTHDEGDDTEAVDQKYEFCDFPIINDCDIMEIINLDDPFINIPDDDNTTTVNEAQELQMPDRVNHLPSAHELLQAHLLMDEHNYAYVDTEDFKEERQVYKTEKSDSDERIVESSISVDNSSNRNPIYEHCNSYSVCSQNTQDHHISEPTTSTFENRALKPIVTSVSAIQQPSKANGIVVLNESIVKSGGGFQLHACMICQLKFFSVENLKEHYTQTHGTPMVTVPTGNIILERTSESKSKLKREIIENIKTGIEVDYSATQEDVLYKSSVNLKDSIKIVSGCHDILMDTSESENKLNLLKPNGSLKTDVRKDIISSSRISKRQKNRRVRNVIRKNQHLSLNTMARQYQQLKKLYQTLQRKCLNLEQNVEQLQLLPPAIETTKQTKTRNLHNAETKYLLSSKTPAYTCPVCSKTFSNSNCLRQHKITHTEERKHICSLCSRSFKRRNGLLQHLKGFHLQVKPFVCLICNHSYALKCDMLRCKHSTLRISRSIE